MSRERLHEEGVRAYRRANSVAKVLNHSCSKENCTLYELELHACEICGAALSKQCEECRLVSGSYICPTTGYDHLCGEGWCKQVDPCTGRCRLTNNLVRKAASKGALKRQPAHTARNRLRTSHPQKQKWFDLIWALLYGQKRRDYELKRQRQYKIAAERAVQRMMRIPRHPGHPVTYVDLVMEYVSKNDRAASLQHLTADNEVKKSLCNKYAKLVNRIFLAMQLNSLVTNKTDSVAIVLLYLLRGGVTVRDEEIMPFDPFLQRALVSAHAINSVLHSSTTISFTQVKNAINRHLRELTSSQIQLIREVFEEHADY